MDWYIYKDSVDQKNIIKALELIIWFSPVNEFKVNESYLNKAYNRDFDWFWINMWTKENTYVPIELLNQFKSEGYLDYKNIVEDRIVDGIEFKDGYTNIFDIKYEELCDFKEKLLVKYWVISESHEESIELKFNSENWVIYLHWKEYWKIKVWNMEYKLFNLLFSNLDKPLSFSEMKSELNKWQNQKSDTNYISAIKDKLDKNIKDLIKNSKGGYILYSKWYQERNKGEIKEI